MLVSVLDRSCSESWHHEGFDWDDNRASYGLADHLIILLANFAHGWGLCSHYLRLLKAHQFLILRWLGTGQDIGWVVLNFSTQLAPRFWPPPGVLGWDAFPSRNIFAIRRFEIIISKVWVRSRWDHPHRWRLLSAVILHFSCVVNYSPIDSRWSDPWGSWHSGLVNIDSFIHGRQHVHVFLLLVLCFLGCVVLVGLLS